MQTWRGAHVFDRILVKKATQGWGLRLGTCVNSALGQADGNGINLYSASSPNRYNALEVNADSGSHDLSGDVYVSAIKGNFVLGTSSTNASIIGVLGMLNTNTRTFGGGGHFGVRGHLDFWGATSLVAGAGRWTGGVSAYVEVESTLTVGAGHVLMGVESRLVGGAGITNSGLTAGVHVSGAWQYGVYITGCTMPLYATAALTGATSASKNAVDIEVTDTATISSNTNRGIYVNYASSGAKTSSAEIDGIGVDLAITADCPAVYGITLYSGTISNKTIGNIGAISVYWEDVGNAVANMMLVDLGRNITNRGSSRDCFVRCKQNDNAHRGKTVFYIEGTNNYMASSLFTFCGCLGSSDLFIDAAVGGSNTAKLHVTFESTPGGSATEYYIPLYTS